jgi:hypothetical protein
MTLRILAVIAFLIAIILFAFAAFASVPSAKDVPGGLIAVAAGLILMALEGVVPTRTP